MEKKMVPYLVQRGTFKKENYGTNKLAELINFDYMGSAEFEFGALWYSLERILQKLDEYTILKVKEVKDIKGNTMLVFGNKNKVKELIEVAKGLAQDTYILKEYSGINSYIKGDRWIRDNFWWDINNDFFIFFEEGKETLIKKALKNQKEQLITKIEEQPEQKPEGHYYTFIMSNTIEVFVGANNVVEAVKNCVESHGKLIKTAEGIRPMFLVNDKSTLVERLRSQGEAKDIAKAMKGKQIGEEFLEKYSGRKYILKHEDEKAILLSMVE